MSVAILAMQPNNNARVRVGMRCSCVHVFGVRGGECMRVCYVYVRACYVSVGVAIIHTLSMYMHVRVTAYVHACVCDICDRAFASVRACVMRAYGAGVRACMLACASSVRAASTWVVVNAVSGAALPTVWLLVVIALAVE